MGELLAFLFCASTGFAIAGTATSFYQLVTSKRAEFLAQRSGVSGAVIAVLLTMLGGPHIVISKIVDGLRARQLKALPAACGVLVAGMWSVVAGLFFLGLLVTA